VADDTEPMGRVSVPEADREIGVRHPVLTHGFVALVDYMGNDAAIVQAARVSYGKGTKSVRDDRGLIRYLMRHRHTTPFEMVEFKFLVRLPIYVARQWIRHRTACLAEGTRVYFDLPSSGKRRRRRIYTLTVEQLWSRFQPTRNREARHQRNPLYRRDRLRAMKLRQLNEDSRIFQHTRVLNVLRNGQKPTFRMFLEGGKHIDCTADHRFLFDEGWSTLSERTGLREVGGRAVWTEGEYSITVNGAQVARPALYQDRAWLETAYLLKGRSIADIAEACGVGEEAVRARLDAYGIPRVRMPSNTFGPGNRYYELRRSSGGGTGPRSPHSTARSTYQSKEWLEARWVGEQLSTSQIANACAVSVPTIRKWLWVHRLTNHPGHDSHPQFRRGNVPWNLGRTYRLGRRPASAEMLAIIRAARSGAASNFWKGGTSTEREGIGRWTTQMAPSIHARNHFTCQLCHRRKPKLHAHHIVPVWADLSKARDPANLTTLCDECHREVHRDERKYVERLGGPPIADELIRPRGIPWSALTVGQLARVERFEFLGMRETYDLEVEGPFHNFVANGIVTHNSVNEYSARYSVVPDEYEVPAAAEVHQQSTRNRQGRGGPVAGEISAQFRSDLDRISQDAYAAYSRALDSGVARETARTVLPVSFYTQWYWKINLHNMLHFLSLRLDEHSQEEIRLYAAEIAKLGRIVAPVAFEAFEEFEIEGLSLSQKEQLAVKALLEGKSPEEACAIADLPLARADGNPMTSGEGVEFLQKLGQIRRVE
jgi:thymidylate synthase (FAD)